MNTIDNGIISGIFTIMKQLVKARHTMNIIAANLYQIGKPSGSVKFEHQGQQVEIQLRPEDVTALMERVTEITAQRLGEFVKDMRA